MLTRRAAITRRACLSTLAGAGGLMLPFSAGARTSKPAKPAKKLSFDEWVAAFRAKAQARGISEATYTRVMRGLKPDRTGLQAIGNQPEFHEELWQYLNRRVSEWRIIAGRQQAKEKASLFARIEH